MQAIILAAGLGTRLRPLTDDRPKAMVTILAEPTLHRTIRQLKNVGITEIIIVVGYKSEVVIKETQGKFEGVNVTFIINSLYYETGTAFSFYLAASKALEDVILIEGDVLFDISILERIIKNKRLNNLGAVAKFIPPLNGTVVEIDGSKIKSYFTKVEAGAMENVWKTINIYRFEKSLVEKLCFTFKKNPNAFKNSYLECLLFTLVKSGEDIQTVDCTDLLWFEVDDVNDLIYAQGLFSARKDFNNDSIFI